MQNIPDVAADATPIEQADVAVLRRAAGARDHVAIKAVGRLAEFADQPPLIALSAATLAAGLVARSPRLARAGGRMLAAHLLATYAKKLVKDRVDRTRPSLLVDEGRYDMRRGTDGDGELGSFPSGHTAGIVAVTRALAREYPRATLPGAALSAAVAAVQIPRCAHYPSDIAAGAAIGLAAEAAVDLIVKRLD